jgi:hypothetical protein
MKDIAALMYLSAVFGCWALSAQEASGPAFGSGLAERFKQLDRNGDGKVTREEAAQLPLFDQWDADQDGAVTMKEVTAFYSTRRAAGTGSDTRPAAPAQPAPAAKPKTPADGFVTDAPFVGEIGGSYIDPEFSETANQVVFQDMQNRVWIGDIDPSTGRFKTATGRDYLMDENITIIFDRPPQGRKFSTNGPEWTRDEKGHLVVYTKADAAGIMQQWSARLVEGKPVFSQLTRQPYDCYGNMPSRFLDGKPPRVAYTHDWPIGKAKAAWIFLDQPGEPRELANFDYRQMSMWSAVSPHFLFVQTPPGAPHGQVALSDADTGAVRVLTADAGEKNDPGLFRAPEFGGELLLVCNVDNRALAIYRDESKDGMSPWSRIATLALPEDAPYKFISSPETIASATGVGGVSYFSLLAREGKDRNTPGSIWVLGLGKDEKNRLARRVDDGAVTGEQATVLEPEPFVGTNEVYVYYNYFSRATGRHGLRRAATGIQVGASAPATKQAFTVEDVRVSPPGIPMVDPEFNDVQHRVAYWDYAGGRLNISVAELDPRTGLLKNASGCDFAVAEQVSPCFKDGGWWSHNGPEWGRDRNGWAIYFTKEDAQGNRQMWRAVEKDGRYLPEQLTAKPGGHYGALISQSATAADTRMLFYSNLDVGGQDDVAWALASKPNEFHPLPDWRGSHSIARIVGAHHIGYAPRDKAGVPQVVLLDTRTGQRQIVTGEPGDKFDTYGFRAPEFGGELLLMANIDRQRLALYRDVKKDGAPWQKIAELRLPQDSPFKYIYSCEPIAPETGVNGVSYFSLNATKTPGSNRGETGRAARDGSIWVLGLGKDPANHLIRRVDEGAVSGIETTRYESESFAGTEEVFIYYERKDPETGRGELRRCRTGIRASGKSPATPKPQPTEKP